MQSSYNIIKNKNVITEGKQEISTKGYEIIEKEEIEEQLPIQSTVDNEELFKSMENMAESIIGNAQIKSEKILVEALEKSKKLEKDAFDKGSVEGYKDGFEKGYNEGLEKASIEGEGIINNAMKVLENAKKEYKNYIKEKEDHFRELIILAIEEVLKEEIKNKEVLNNVVYDVLSKEKNENYFIIRCNSTHKEALENEKPNIINKLAFNGDIFIVEDDSLEDGRAVIEKENGKVEIEFKYIMDKLQELIMER